MNKKMLCKNLLVSTFALAFAAGCASRGTTGADTAGTASGGTTVEGPSSNAAGTGGLGQGSAITGNDRGGSAAYDISKKTVYFAYDSSEIEPDSQSVVDNFGRYLTANPGRKVRLEGNTDERGSREYNLALSERRAQTVQRALKAAGVSDGQLSTVAYGEERPADPGHDEAAWAKNRRVDIVE